MGELPPTLGGKPPPSHAFKTKSLRNLPGPIKMDTKPEPKAQSSLTEKPDAKKEQPMDNVPEIKWEAIKPDIDMDEMKAESEEEPFAGPDKEMLKHLVNG